jgi:hypothetical protein
MKTRVEKLEEEMRILDFQIAAVSRVKGLLERIEDTTGASVCALELEALNRSWNIVQQQLYRE